MDKGKDKYLKDVWISLKEISIWIFKTESLEKWVQRTNQVNQINLKFKDLKRYIASNERNHSTKIKMNWTNFTNFKDMTSLTSKTKILTMVLACSSSSLNRLKIIRCERYYWVKTFVICILKIAYLEERKRRLNTMRRPCWWALSF